MSIFFSLLQYLEFYFEFHIAFDFSDEDFLTYCFFLINLLETSNKNKYSHKNNRDEPAKMEPVRNPAVNGNSSWSGRTECNTFSIFSAHLQKWKAPKKEFSFHNLKYSNSFIACFTVIKIILRTLNLIYVAINLKSNYLSK